MDLDSLLASYARPDVVAGEALDSRVRHPDTETLLTSLHQINLERMSISGRPSARIMAALLAQHDRNDVNIVVNVVKKSMKAIVRNPKYYVHRFQRLVAAVRLIRHVWLAARFRFAVKLQKLVRKWEREEVAAQREQLQARKAPAGGGRASGAAHRRPSSGNAAAAEFLSVQTPHELKRKVFLTQYKKSLDTFLLRWNHWHRSKRAFDMQMRDAARMHPSRRDALVASLAAPPPEPEHRWFQHLASLSPQQRFEISMGLQRMADVNTIAARLEGHEGDPRAVSEYIARHGEVRDDWVTASMAALDGYMQQLDERERALSTGSSGGAAGAANATRAKYAHITSKIFASFAGPSSSAGADTAGGTSTSPERGGEGTRGGETRRRKQRTSGGTLEELRAELPNLSRLKSTPWNMPPRPLQGSFVRRSELQRHCNPPSLAALDPMAQSLAVRGISQPPAGCAGRGRCGEILKEQEKERERLMRAVAEEVRCLPATFCPPREMLRSRRALEITLGLKLGALRAGGGDRSAQRKTRPHSAH